MVPINWSPEMRLETYREMSKFVGTQVQTTNIFNTIIISDTCF